MYVLHECKEWFTESNLVFALPFMCFGRRKIVIDFKWEAIICIQQLCLMFLFLTIKSAFIKNTLVAFLTHYLKYPILCHIFQPIHKGLFESEVLLWIEWGKKYARFHLLPLYVYSVFVVPFCELVFHFLCISRLFGWDLHARNAKMLIINTTEQAMKRYKSPAVGRTWKEWRKSEADLILQRKTSRAWPGYYHLNYTHTSTPTCTHARTHTPLHTCTYTHGGRKRLTGIYWDVAQT